MQRKPSDRVVRVGEVFMECNGKAGLTGFGFLAAGRKRRSVGPKTAVGGTTATRRIEGRRLGAYWPEAGCQNEILGAIEAGPEDGTEIARQC